MLAGRGLSDRSDHSGVALRMDRGVHVRMDSKGWLE
jgi:hypothetical protein